LPDRIPRVLLHGVHVPDNNTPGDYDARTSQRPAGTTRAPCPASIWRAAASSILAQHTVVNVLDDARAVSVHMLHEGHARATDRMGCIGVVPTMVYTGVKAHKAGRTSCMGPRQCDDTARRTRTHWRLRGHA
jgi:hypothetical protein